MPVSFCPVTAGAAVGIGTWIPTVGFGEPCRWPGELAPPDVDGLAFGVTLGGPGVGVGPRVRVGVGSAGTGEIAERVAACGAADDAAPAGDAGTDDAAADAWAAAEEAAAELDAAPELTFVELPGA